MEWPAFTRIGKRLYALFSISDLINEVVSDTNGNGMGWSVHKMFALARDTICIRVLRTTHKIEDINVLKTHLKGLDATASLGTAPYATPTNMRPPSAIDVLATRRAAGAATIDYNAAPPDLATLPLRYMEAKDSCPPPKCSDR